MLALIHREGVVAMLDVGGRPLLSRQIQWLRSMGCGRIAVELGDDPLAERIAQWLAEDEIAAPDLCVVLAVRGTPLRELANRAGFDPRAPFLAIPGDVLGDGDLVTLYARADCRGVVARLGAPSSSDAALGGARVQLIGEPDSLRGRRRSIVGPGLGVRVRSAAHALSLGAMVLSGSFGHGVFPVHAHERAPGVFVARGAQIDPSARLVAPVFVGREAWIDRDAVVGPFAVVGARAVVERGARVERSLIDDAMIVGEELTLEGCRVTLDGVEDLGRLGSSVPIDDPMLVAPRDRGESTLAARTLALLCLPTLAPLRALGVSSLPSASSLIEVLRGARPLVGVGGAFDIEPALVDDRDEDDALKERARAWYEHEKSPSLDLRLVLTTLTR